ncbi:MAG: Holliday junction resolvase RuvX [Chloroflexota bacterium]|nr:Holliday junction resolvase RuvX [Chloroflexota bacterium]
MRLLGVDVGARRIGVAVGEGRVAVPLTIIAHESRAADIARIGELARAQAAEAIVVGLPLSMSGEEHAQAARTRAFGEALALGTGLPVVYQDERLSTVQVSGAGIGGGTVRARPGVRVRDPGSVHPARRRGKPRVDDLAAAVILQAYLDAR